MDGSNFSRHFPLDLITFSTRSYDRAVLIALLGYLATVRWQRCTSVVLIVNEVVDLIVRPRVCV